MTNGGDAGMRIEQRWVEERCDGEDNDKGMAWVMGMIERKG